MKKYDLTHLATLGISAALLAGGCQKNDRPTKEPKIATVSSATMTQEMHAFYNTLSPKAQEKFMDLDAHHRMMAVEMAHQSCAGKNACAGMGGCATDNNACAGLNSCKNKGGAPVQDANKAVDVQYDNQFA